MKEVRGLLLPTTPPNPIKITLHTPSTHQKHNHQHPNFVPKPQLLIYNNQLSIHTKPKQLTVVNLQSQTTN